MTKEVGGRDEFLCGGCSRHPLCRGKETPRKAAKKDRKVSPRLLCAFSLRLLAFALFFFFEGRLEFKRPFFLVCRHHWKFLISAA